MMIRGKLRYHVTLAIGVTLTVVFACVAYFYVQSQEQSILADYKRSLHKVTDSLSKGLSSIMVENHAEIMPAYAARLKSLRGFSEFVILRTDGSEAFRDNLSINSVNALLGSQAFATHSKPEHVQNMNPTTPAFARVLASVGDESYEVVDGNGRRQLVFLDAIPGGPSCIRCHGADQLVRGVIKIVAPMNTIETEILKMRIQTILVIGAALILSTLCVGYLLGQSVVHPIEAITGAMARISSGEFDSKVPLQGGGEIKRMAETFNLMTASLKRGYDLLLIERGKLTTIIEAAREAIIVTNANDEIVLINKAAAEILEKTDAQIRQEGFLCLLDDAALMNKLLHGVHTQTVVYRGRTLQVSAASIDTKHGRLMGSAALIRDVTEEHRMLDELKRISITDALTGLFNRRYIDTTLATEFDRARRTNKPLSVLLLDVDFFKKFNDTHGHDQGDRVLQAVGACMKSSIRHYDSACRYGGEEFVMILPETGVQGACTIGNRLRVAVEEMEVDGLKVTISLGAATYPGLDVRKAEQLLEAADAALYKSKEAGRNRLTSANET